MQKILIYRDQGVDLFSAKSLVWALKQEKMDETHLIDWVGRDLLKSRVWQEKTDLIIFPGGRDVPYHDALQGIGNRHLLEFVQHGGRFLGICAGGYYGSASIEFEKGGPLEVIAKRELSFFPGTASGPAYGLGKFRYQADGGVQIAQLKTCFSSITTSSLFSYYNGGSAFLQTEQYPSVSVIARYEDLEGEPAAIVNCSVGKGMAILSGVHPEHSAYFSESKNFIRNPSFFALLREVEKERRLLFATLLQQLGFTTAPYE